jgi:hypothetical protein
VPGALVRHVGQACVQVCGPDTWARHVGQVCGLYSCVSCHTVWAVVRLAPYTQTHIVVSAVDEVTVLEEVICHQNIIGVGLVGCAGSQCDRLA